MSYLILLVTVVLALGTLLHLRRQLRKTACIRQDLREARTSKTVAGLHSLRNKNEQNISG